MATKFSKPKPVKAHNFTLRTKVVPWPFCQSCGLILLKNEATSLARNKPCLGKDNGNETLKDTGGGVQAN